MDVTGTTGSDKSLTRLSLSLAPALAVLPVVSVTLLAAAVLLRREVPVQVLATAALAVLIAYAALRILLARHRLISGMSVASVASVVANDPATCFVTAPIYCFQQ